MTTDGSHSSERLTSAAAILCEHYVALASMFGVVAARACERFEQRDWHGIQADANERLELVRQRITVGVQSIHEHLGRTQLSKDEWAKVRTAFAEQTESLHDRELAETFFNSVTRRVFSTVGADWDLEFGVPRSGQVALGRELIFKTFYLGRVGPPAIREILRAFPLNRPYEDIDLDAHLIVEQIRAAIKERWGTHTIDTVEFLQPIFFRNKGAYLIGRLRKGEEVMPFVLALLHREKGVYVDAVLMDEEEVSVVFSFTRSYFHVNSDRYREIIDFLGTILPHKRIAELYIALGLVRHGKREFYHDLRNHLEQSTDKFEVAAGQRGMVMAVFTLPSYDVVFKLIKDTFAFPKVTTREIVRAKYQFVSQHDRVGRLVDAQEFEFLELDKGRFAPELLQELLTVAPSTVQVVADKVLLTQLYVERRVTPLDLYLRQVTNPEVATPVALDFGYAIKDLAAADIFPGDLFLKNFGVTRHGRVVFYDYDELCRVTECNFRRVPASRHDDDEMSAEPWFSVGEADIFPEELKTFLGIQEPLRAEFLRVHGDLYAVDFWHRMQALHQAGEIIDIFPYPPNRHLRRRMESQLSSQGTLV